MRDWDAVVALARRVLPAVELGTTYGNPAIKHRGKMLAATTAPDPGSFVLHVALADKEVLLETDPGMFWETDHYHGWPAVLVRYGADADRVALLLRRAWWDRAGARERKAFGDRP